jgi:hypothetical protein
VSACSLPLAPRRIGCTRRSLGLLTDSRRCTTSAEQLWSCTESSVQLHEKFSAVAFDMTVETWEMSVYRFFGYERGAWGL